MDRDVPNYFTFDTTGLIKVIRRNIADERFVFEERMLLNVDDAKSPKEINIVVRGNRFGIYKLEGDTLTLCWNEDYDGHRPVDFKTEPGTELVMYVLVRGR
jgi:uncharacterized protein (TIGR03067 family)